MSATLHLGAEVSPPHYDDTMLELGPQSMAGWRTLFKAWITLWNSLEATSQLFFLFECTTAHTDAHNEESKLTWVKYLDKMHTQNYRYTS